VPIRPFSPPRLKEKLDQCIQHERKTEDRGNHEHPYRHQLLCFIKHAALLRYACHVSAFVREGSIGRPQKCIRETLGFHKNGDPGFGVDLLWADRCHPIHEGVVGSAALRAVALMCAIAVVELQVAVQVALQCSSDS
jgi:hypothetical protein